MALAVLAPATASAASFDTTTGKVTIGPGALRTITFDDPESVVAAGARVGRISGTAVALDSAPASASAIAPLLVTGETAAVEGTGALRVERTTLFLFDRPSFDAVKGARFEVTLWTRSEGLAPLFNVLYGPTDAVAVSARPFAAVRLQRTGRETSDGWAELTTGPLDGSVHGVGVRAVAILPRFGVTGGAFLVDALEIRRVDDRVTPPSVCSQDDVDTTCGPEGDCLYGRCVPASITWGALPTPDMRRALVRTWIHLATHVLGDRGAAARGSTFAAEATRLASEARSSRELQGGLARRVNGLRNKHTSFGGVPLSTPFDPRLGSSVDHGIGCFGVVEKDLLGGGFGYGVFRATPGGPLRNGDVVASIDGQEPKAWVDRHYPAFAPTVPGDPRADWGASATALAELLVTRARTVTLTRCASGTACEGPDRETVTVAVADDAFRGLLAGATAGAAFACTPRFRDAVTSPRGRVGNEDAVDAESRPDGEVSVQFDGFSGGTGWDAAVRGVFDGRPERVLMDARVGRGGSYGALKTLLALVRGPAEPLGFFAVLRDGHDAMDSPRLFELARPCAEGRGDDRACYGLGVDVAFQSAGTAEPPGAATKIAWLNTNDASANDFAARLVKGRAHTRVFAPHPTSGAFGQVVSVPPLLGFTGTGAIQVQDTRFSASPSEVLAAAWESGRGVEPDEVVAQRLSDLLNGEDTLLRVARAWLVAP